MRDFGIVLICLGLVVMAGGVIHWANAGGKDATIKFYRSAYGPQKANEIRLCLLGPTVIALGAWTSLMGLGLAIAGARRLAPGK